MATSTDPAKLSSAHIGEATIKRGPGGETHQIAEGNTPVLTTQQGIPVADDQNSLKIGAHHVHGSRNSSMVSLLSVSFRR